MINYHSERSFQRETQEGTREGAHEGDVHGCVGLPFGPAVPAIETTDSGGLEGSLQPENFCSVIFLFKDFTSE